MHPRDAVVIVTGASSGIGREAALAFARHRARLVLAARREDRLHQLAEEIAALGAEALAVPTDVARTDDCARLVQAALDRFGRVDVLVNNAGFGFSGTIEETTESDMRELLDVNYMGAFNLTRAVLPHMRRQRRGHIVNVASVVGKVAFPFHGAYSATKFAMIAMTEALRGELDGSGVTATAVLPASTRTEFFDAQRTNDGHVSAPTGPQQDAAVVARAIVRSLRHPAPEVNMVRAFRLAYGLNGFFPALRDVAGRQFYRRSHGKPRRKPPPR
ncbi:MAG TPA: SDR family NAD(P)-dependent oxidoreductase [Dehalococcoidia bacterium]|nr:SDR family NAD(P)-dependent oxidoreductase [Dehalococcoidia bacterium]